MSDRREKIAKKYVPCRCDEIYTSRGLTAPDCPFHSTDPEAAMDEYFTERALELLEYMANYRVECRKGYKSLGETEIIPLFNYKGEWINAQQLFENFL